MVMLMVMVLVLLPLVLFLDLVSASLSAGVTLRRFMRRLMVSMCVLELYVRCVELC